MIRTPFITMNTMNTLPVSVCLSLSLSHTRKWATKGSTQNQLLIHVLCTFLWCCFFFPRKRREPGAKREEEQTHSSLHHFFFTGTSFLLTSSFLCIITRFLSFTREDLSFFSTSCFVCCPHFTFLYLCLLLLLFPAPRDASQVLVKESPGKL